MTYNINATYYHEEVIVLEKFIENNWTNFLIMGHLLP